MNNNIILPAQNNKLVTMDRNLGATSNIAGEVGALGLLYQWGRKDPFLSSLSISKNSQFLPKVGTIIRASMDLGTLISCTYNPNVFYPSNGDVIYNGHLSGVKGYNRWGGVANNDNKKQKKSIYDPSPFGWCVPFGVDWCELENDDNFIWDTSNKMGRNYMVTNPTNFFPASGLLWFSNASLKDIGKEGYYWSGTPADAFHGRAMIFNSTKLLINGWFYRSYGCYLRLVKD